MDLKAPLYSLSIEQFFSLFKEEVLALVKQAETPINLAESDTADVTWVHHQTKLQPSTIYSKVCRKQMPCIHRRKPLLFSKKAILEWMEAGMPSEQDVAVDNYMESRKKKNSPNSKKK